MGVRGGNWLRHCARIRKVMDSNPVGFIGIFLSLKPSDRPVSQRTTRLLTEMNTRNTSWGIKEAAVLGWQSCRIYLPIVYKFGETQPSETLLTSKVMMFLELWNWIKIKKRFKKKLTFYRDQDLDCIKSLSRQRDFENIKNKKGSNFVTQ